MTSSGLSQLFSWIAIGCSLRQNGFGLAFAAHIPDSPALAEFNFSIMVFSRRISFSGAATIRQEQAFNGEVIV
jgi:hypothetical protein